MKQAVVYTILPICLLLVACASRTANAQANGEPVFSVTTKISDDAVTLQFKDNTTTIEIYSPTGIGSATVELESGRMPEQIVARLHLKGLEEARLISEQVTVAASVLGENAQGQRKIVGNGEQALRSNDPLWLDIQIVSVPQDIPLEDGYFEIRFPEEFIQGSGGMFEIQWVDFFR